ncbi:hypothetical protein E2I00_012908 [Balaenoptera physalus]|uniref:G-protein coupled receptors family 2 profile 2 domain-containing protein n=1 Tax=Balaenoptera physalus TaxID=9770 RepID=A0A643C713_BALPH|nr:hypothetical protein E2I00_012908 [Balaenoptera physalus]
MDDKELEVQASSVLVIDTLLKTRYSQRIGDDLSVSIWLSDGVSSQIRPLGLWALGGRQLGGPHSCCPRGQAVAGCRVAAVFMQYGVVANYCWLLVEGVYLHSLLGFATIPERSCFPLYLGIGWGAPMLFVTPWVVVKCLFENIQCWTSNDNMGFWWILRFPVFLAILVQSELLRRWHRWREGKALQEERHVGSHTARPSGGPPSEKLLLSRGGGSNRTSQDPSAETHLAGGLPGLAENPF